MERVSVSIPLENVDELLGLFGVFDENIGVLEEETGASIRAEASGVRISGEREAVGIAQIVVEKMLQMQRRGEKFNRSRIRYAIDLAKEGNADMIEKIMGDVIAITNKGRQIKCKTLGQKRYVQALKEFELVFGIGPAGTGKTYLAVAMAVQAFKNKEVERIILTRPA
jgi:phosphate starvation-inducible PhoH-like protein